MSQTDDAKKVNKNILKIYNRKELALLALSINTAALALNYFRSVQLTGTGNAGKYWINRTESAARQVFTEPIKTKRFIGWLIAHGVEYGQYLELANNRKNEALSKIINKFFQNYFESIIKLYKD